MPFYKRLHYLFWDLEKYTLPQVMDSLRKEQATHALTDYIKYSGRFERGVDTDDIKTLEQLEAALRSLIGD